MFIRTAAATIAALTIAGAAQAATYEYEFTSTISSAMTPGVSVGDTFTLDLFLDNGNSTNASQTWDGSDVVSFTITAGSYTASYTVPWGGFSFSTDASGNVTGVTLYGTDYSSQNSDTFTASYTGDYVFGDAAFNDSLYRYNTVTAGGFNDASAWSAVSSVPEPASLALSLAALAAFGATRRRRA